MRDLPDKVPDIDLIRIMRSVGKECYCPQPKYVMDQDTRTVYCRKCGAQMDAFRALEKLARNWELVRSQVNRLLEERQALLAWEPHRVAMKEINDHFTHKATQNMIPVCPHCDRGIELLDLVKRWVDRDWAKRDEVR